MIVFTFRRLTAEKRKKKIRMESESDIWVEYFIKLNSITCQWSIDAVNAEYNVDANEAMNGIKPEPRYIHTYMFVYIFGRVWAHILSPAVLLFLELIEWLSTLVQNVVNQNALQSPTEERFGGKSPKCQESAQCGTYVSRVGGLLPLSVSLSVCESLTDKANVVGNHL